MNIRAGTAADDPILIEHYMALWDSYGTPPEHYAADARQIVQAFLDEAREKHGLRTFLAHVGSEVAGSAACQLQVSPYPAVVDPRVRRFGYVWHVFVRPDFGRRGLGRALTQAALDGLRDLGCTTAVLNASEAGEALYASMGFSRAKEMRLKLTEPN